MLTCAPKYQTFDLHARKARVRFDGLSVVGARIAAPSSLDAAFLCPERYGELQGSLVPTASPSTCIVSGHPFDGGPGVHLNVGGPAMRSTNNHTQTKPLGNIFPRLSDMAKTSAVQAFFRRGEGNGPSAPVIAPRDPVSPAPSVLEMELA